MNIQGIFISFRIDWFELLVVQRTLKSLLQRQFERSNFSVLSLLYGQLSDLYMTTGKTMALNIQNLWASDVSAA